ncbi:uncharacterized protein TrAtP1_002720 [Trichoderma atroviride]|uniref:uncharacterized protein n=1 Tax=Hypocrea atroviridis TaxID=63577 RepID=UPI003332486D|nr:hypothetical protein TrAtP1_002720 [Trichoderma atroviride]
MLAESIVDVGAELWAMLKYEIACRFSHVVARLYASTSIDPSPPNDQKRLPISVLCKTEVPDQVADMFS